ncbi:MAG TPA: ABC transporter permease [Sporichthyaceae bacterium]|jgi:putative ABC transport system permease protein|nr:ABC transporter permease [Sporichthyaceae bacterium]
MRIGQTVNFAWGGIVANKMRAALTMLGIVIGVASVITLIAVGTGSNQAVAASISRLGSNTLYVLPMPTGTGGHGSALQQRLRRMLGINSKPDNSTHDSLPQLRFSDAQALADRAAVPDVSQVAPVVVLHNVATTDANSSHTTAVVLGTTANYFGIDNDTVSAGQMFTAAQNAAHARVAVVGTSVAADLVTGADSELIGRQILINGQGFTVIGILGSKGYSGNTDLDDKIVTPVTSAEDALYGYAPAGEGQLSAIAVSSTSPATLQAAQDEVQILMDQRDHVSAVNSQVVVFNSAAILGASSSAGRTLTILLAAVAGISLLVGGIGVMNIMLVSVTERTREIGIRKAIGAQARTIVAQFLTEAVIVSMLGGMLGVLIGLVASRFTIAGIQPVVAPWSIWLALGVSLFTGLFFGFYPAHRAAALRPIEALRYQ